MVQGKTCVGMSPSRRRTSMGLSSTTRVRRPTRSSAYAVASAVVAFLVDGLYLRELARQSPGYPEPWFPAILASAIACLGVAALVASLIRFPPFRHTLLTVATIGFFLLSPLSIGLPLIVAGCFSLVSLVSSIKATGSFF